MTNWDARTGGGSASRLASVLEGLLLNYSDTRSRLPGEFYASDYAGYDSSGATSSQASIISAVNAAHAAGGGIVVIGRGNFMLSSQLSFTTGCANVTIRGAGKGATRFFRDPAASTYFNMLSGSGYQNLTFEDITFDGTQVFQMGFLVVDDWRGHTWRRCEFKNFLNQGIYGYSTTNGRVFDCDFYDETGRGAMRGIEFQQGARDWTIENNTFDWCQSCVYHGGSYIGWDLRINRNRVDGHWWQLPSAVANSGGTVTYGGSTVVDSTAPFAALVAGYVGSSRVVRALKVAVTGTGAFSTFNGWLVDGSANFSSVKEGWEIRTAAKHCIVERVGSMSTANDTVFCGQWYELGSNWGKKTTAPVGATAYTIYQPYWGRVLSMTSTTLTLDVPWTEFGTGANVTPPAGTRYELMVPHNDLIGVFLGPGTHDCEMIGNRIEATFREGLINFGSSMRTIGNLMRFQEDYGITYDNDTVTIGSAGVISGNIVQAAAGGGIYVGGDDVVVTGNDCEGCSIGRYTSTPAGIILNAKRVNCTANKLTGAPTNQWEQASSFLSYGVMLMAGASDCLVAHNHSRGASVSDVFADSGSGPNNKLFENDGTLTVHASATAPLIRHQGTGVPAILAAKGSTFARTDGGAGTCLYVNEAGTTTWVAK